jgi:hypothetical protein
MSRDPEVGESGHVAKTREPAFAETFAKALQRHEAGDKDLSKWARSFIRRHGITLFLKVFILLLTVVPSRPE